MTPPPGSDSDLLYRVLQLRNDVDDLGVAIDSLPARLGDLSSSIDEIRTAMRQVQNRSADVEATCHDLLATVKRLDARVEWLERNIRLQSSTSEVELDDVGAQAREMAQVAEAGHVARAELLSPSTRSSLESAVQAHAEAVWAQVHHRQVALEAVDVLVTTGRHDPEHAAAISRFREAVAARDQARGRIRELAGAAVEAAGELEVDDQQQIAVADVIAEGEHAWTQLQTRLRARLAEAVGDGALLPAWFTAVLGPIPPARDTRAWMDVGTSLLAYRVTYGVSDPVVALGRPPGTEETARRRAWFAQLRRQCNELQR